MIHENARATRTSAPPRDRAFAHRQAGGLAELFQVAVTTAPTAPVPVIRDPPVSAPTRRPQRPWRDRLVRHPWPLAAILTVQAALSLRLVWSNTAFPDEALYLWSGHLEWTHWLHGTPIPAFQTYFSGAPVIYPPLGALADTWGGLAGARLLSLVFMLGATCCLHATARRMFDTRAAGFAAALFAGLAATQYLGAFATYDAMALFLMALSAWLGIRAVDSAGWARELMLAGAGAVTALADATKYAAALFTPVLVAVIVCWAGIRQGRRSALGAGMIVFWTLFLAAAGLLIAGGHGYLQGIRYTTLARSYGSATAPFLLFVSAKWEGAVLLLALIGAAAAAVAWRQRAGTIMACVLAGSALLVPAEQARIHTYTSLFKHIGYGAWFAAILGGFALASFMRAVPAAKAASALRVSLATAVLVGVPSLPWAADHFGWPDATRMIPMMRAQMAAHPGPLLADDRGNVFDYYLPSQMMQRTVVGTWFFAYNDPATGRHLTGAAAYAAAIRERYFSVVMLEFWDTATTDRIIRADVEAARGYRLVADFTYPAFGSHGPFEVWVREGALR